MAEPATTSAAIFSVAKAWSILAGVFGSVMPILALSDQKRITFKNALFMAIVGSSFAIFVGPWIALYFGLTSLEAVSALSWLLGATGVYIIRAVLKWLDKRGEEAVGQIVNKVIGGTSPALVQDETGTHFEVLPKQNSGENLEDSK
ncbi:hypothetical protein D3C87_460170 [compost metagenome]